MGKQWFFILLAILLVSGGLWVAFNRQPVVPESMSAVVNDMPATALDAQAALNTLVSLARRKGMVEIDDSTGSSERLTTTVVGIVDGRLHIEVLEEMIMTNGKLSPAQYLKRTSFPLARLDPERLEVKTSLREPSVYSLTIELLPGDYLETIDQTSQRVGDNRKREAVRFKSGTIRFRSNKAAEEALGALQILILAHQQPVPNRE